MKKGGGVPPMDDLFKQAKVIQNQRPVTVTEHIVTFQGCHIGFLTNLDENTRIVQNYILQIQDPSTNTVYRLIMDEVLKDELTRGFNEAPAVGERVAE